MIVMVVCINMNTENPYITGLQKKYVKKFIQILKEGNGKHVHVHYDDVMMTSYLVIECRSSEDQGDIVEPLRFVAPCLLAVVLYMYSPREANQPVRELLPGLRGEREGGGGKDEGKGERKGGREGGREGGRRRGG